MNNIEKVDSSYGVLWAYKNDHITEHIKKYGAHSKAELTFFLTTLETGDYVFDLGAHIGSFSIPMAQKIGQTGRLLAIEGVSKTCSLLSSNLKENQVDQWACCINVVVSPSADLQLIFNKHNTGASFFQICHSNEKDSSIITTSIKELSSAHFIPKVIKLDLEGFEYLALENLALNELQFPILFLEVSSQLLCRTGSDIDQLNSLLVNTGYRLFRNLKKGNSQTGEFLVGEIKNLNEGREHFNVLAIHEKDTRLIRLLKCWKNN